MIERIKKFREYLDYIERHYNNVQNAWSLIQQKCKGQSFRFLSDDDIFKMIDDEVKGYDLSKLSPEEFVQYRQYWFPTDDETPDKKMFKKAWEHHKEHNDHHWQTWTTKYENDITADAYLIMNIVDWVAMGFEFGDTARDYYEKNKGDINLPDWAIDVMNRVFDCIYSPDVEPIMVGDMIVEVGLPESIEESNKSILDGVEEGVYKHLMEWRNLINEQESGENNWSEIPAVPGYMFKNLKILSMDSVELPIDKNNSIDIKIVYDDYKKMEESKQFKHCGSCKHRKWLGIMNKPCTTPNICKDFNNWESNEE